MILRLTLCQRLHSLTVLHINLGVKIHEINIRNTTYINILQTKTTKIQSSSLKAGQPLGDVFSSGPHLFHVLSQSRFASPSHPKRAEAEGGSRTNHLRLGRGGHCMACEEIGLETCRGGTNTDKNNYTDHIQTNVELLDLLDCPVYI